MSMSDSDSSSHGGEYKNFRQISRDRLLHEMLRSAKTGDSKSTWKVIARFHVSRTERPSQGGIHKVQTSEHGGFSKVGGL